MGFKPRIFPPLVVLAVLHLFCFEQLAASSHAAEKNSFSGTWVANGSKEVLALGKARESSVFRLSGHVRLKSGIGDDKDFWARCIGLADSATDSSIRCVWRNLAGNEIYLTLKGSQVQEGSRVTGEIVGGTGKAQGIIGTLNFTWSTMLFGPSDKPNETEIAGFSQDISGSYQIP